MSSKVSLSKTGIFRLLILREPFLDCIISPSTTVHCRGFCGNILELCSQFTKMNDQVQQISV